MNASTLAMVMVSEQAMKIAAKVFAYVVTFVDSGEARDPNDPPRQPSEETVGFMTRKDIARFCRFTRCENGSELFKSRFDTVELKPCIVAMTGSKVTGEKFVHKVMRGNFAYHQGILLLVAKDAKLSVAKEATPISDVNGVVVYAASPHRFEITTL